ncbi:MAG: FAD-dependent oxidoreductase [Lachnospiraceae bacterium]|nr:FAD-dependent oxidoreductase [Lachnospiraceae bacterium]
MLDVLVIGSGPAGLSAAVYAKRANLNVLVVEKYFGGTGQIAESSMVDNYLGFAGISGFDLGEKFKQHAEGLGVEFKEGDAQEFKRIGDIWQVTLKDGNTIETRTVIYAAGAVHRHLGIAGESEFEGKGVSYCATCDGAFFRDKTVAVIGGGDTALDDALYLSDICNKVYLVHRRNEFRGSTGTVERLRKKENTEFVLEAKAAEIAGNGRVEQLILEDGRSLLVDGIFVAVGMDPMTVAIKGVVDLDETGYVVAGETGKTSAGGFFVAGDVRTKVLRQVVTAVSDGANAAVSAERYICFGD